MDVVAGWTGRQAVALQQALRLSNEAFASQLGVAVRTVASWHTRGEVVPRPEMQQLLDLVLEQAPAAVRDRFATLTAARVAGPQVLRAAVAVVVRAAEVLLVCRRDTAAGVSWQFPAGIVKPGGDAGAVAVSETLGETGVHCAVRRRLGERVHPVTGVLCVYLHCDYLAGTARNRDAVENASVTWVPRADVGRFIPTDRIYPPVLETLEA